MVFVGATAVELGDMVPVPLYRSLPGVVVQALATGERHVPGRCAVCRCGMLVAGARRLDTALRTRRHWRTLVAAQRAVLGGRAGR